MIINQNSVIDKTNSIMLHLLNGLANSIHFSFWPGTDHVQESPFLIVLHWLIVISDLAHYFFVCWLNFQRNLLFFIKNFLCPFFLQYFAWLLKFLQNELLWQGISFAWLIALSIFLNGFFFHNLFDENWFLGLFSLSFSFVLLFLLDLHAFLDKTRHVKILWLFLILQNSTLLENLRFSK